MPVQFQFIFGFGYLGSRVGRRWLANGDWVWVVTRSQEKARRLADEGFRPIVADLMDGAGLRAALDEGNVVPPVWRNVLFAVGHDRGSGHSIRDLYVQGLKNALDVLPLPWTGRFLYISSTGVYGQTGGEMVDENSPAEPTREGGRACLEAEQSLTASEIAPRTVILRMAGLYGPGRIPRRQEVERGLPLGVAPNSCVNLIQMDDAATVVLATAAAEHPSRLYVVSDDQPARRGEFYGEMARLLGAPEPQFTLPDQGSHVARRSRSDKRIHSDKMKRELGVRLAFPTFREGLADAVSRDHRSS